MNNNHQNKRIAVEQSRTELIGTGRQSSANLADVLERVLDKGIVIAGDIKILIADIDLLTIKIRLLVASVDKAKEIGLDWWAHDPYLSQAASYEEISEKPGKRTTKKISAKEKR